MTASEILAKRMAAVDARKKQAAIDAQEFWKAHPDLLAAAKATREIFGDGVKCVRQWNLTKD